MSTAIIPLQTASAPSQIAWRATAASAVRGSRRATSETVVRSAAYLEREHPDLLLGQLPLGDVVHGDHAGGATPVRDRPAADLHVASVAGLRDAHDLVPLLALALDPLDQEVVVLGGDDVEHRELDGLVGGVSEHRLERTVDLDDPAVDMDEHGVEEGVEEHAEMRVVADRRRGS
jgi:hypothetical protein